MVKKIENVLGRKYHEESHYIDLDISEGLPESKKHDIK